MEIINGFTIIATRRHPRRNGERCILGARQANDGTWNEYVTAWTCGPEPTSWYAGHYFGQPGSDDAFTLLTATADLVERTTAR